MILGQVGRSLSDPTRHRSPHLTPRTLEEPLVRSHRLALLAAVIAALLASPASAAPTAIPEGATPLPGGGYAKELKAPQPDWYTPQLHRQIIAAGAEGVPIPADADIPASGLAFTGIRPGAWMFAPSWCTMNFIFGGTSTT